MGKSTELSIDLKERITDLYESLGAISKQLQIQRSVQKTIVSIKFMAQLGHYHDQEENSKSSCWEKTGRDGQYSTKTT